MMDIRNGDIGPVRRKIELEPLADPVPEPEQVPEAEPAPALVPVPG